MRNFLMIVLLFFLGACASIDANFPVPEASIVPKFSVEVLDAEERIIRFNNESIIPDAVGQATYTWAFGDGNSSTEISPEHTFESFGEYDVKLVVITSGNGEINEVSQNIAVLQPINIDFTLFYMDVDLLEIIGVGTSNVNIELSGFGSGMALDKSNGKLYYADDDNLELKRVNVDGSNPEILYSGLTGIGSVAIDTVESKVYWTNRTDGVVQRGNMDGSGTVETIIEGVSLPEGIAVYGGKVYVSDVDVPPVGENIYRANTNGSNLEIFVSGSWGYGLGIDPVNERLYFGDQAVFDSPDDNRIKSVSLNDNTDITTIAPLEPIGSTGSRTYGIAINPDEGKVYWTDRSASRINSANFDGSDIQTVLVADGQPRGLALDF